MRRNVDVPPMPSAFTPLRERLLRSHFLVALIGLAVIATGVAVDAGIAVVVTLVVAAWVATLVVSVRAANAIPRPLVALANATAALAARAVLDDLPVEREDEIGVLTRAFNRMRASVAAAEQALTDQAADATHAHAALQAEFLERTQIEAMFPQLLEATPDAVLIVDPHGTIALANPASERVFGYRRDELVGGALGSVVPAALEWAHPLAGSAVDAERAATEPELLALRRDGSTVPVEIRANPFVIDDRTLLAIAVRNVTERQRAAQALRELNAELEQRVLDRTAELRRSNEELERFAAIASHDLQEPLRMVASYTRLLGERYRGRLDADAEEFIGYAVDGVQRMQRLVRDLLAYARVSSRARNPEPTDAEPIFERATANLRLAIAESGAVITRDPLPCVRVDASQLGQLLQNLIDNALKFHADRPLRVHVSAECTREGWMLSVRDNGVGIAPQDAERVFALFERVHRERALPGSGIGLALCKKIVERHGGRIWIEGLEEGAVVRFTLPAVSQDEARRPLRDRPVARAVTVDQRAVRPAGVRA